MEELLGTIFFFMVICGGSIFSFILYFLPTTIALMRKHTNSVAIFALNLLAGWMVIGWIIALVWSLTAKQK